MEVALDMNGHPILNVGHVDAADLTINGQDIEDFVQQQIENMNDFGGSSLHMVVIGDSMSAQQTMFDDAWPTVAEKLLRSAGISIKVTNLAISAHTFERARTVAKFGNKTQVEKAIELQPDIVVVGLGVNDTLGGIDGLSPAQVIEQAGLLFDELTTGIPNVKILWIKQEHWSTSAPDTTDLLNGNVPPWFWNLEPYDIDTEDETYLESDAGDVLDGVYTWAKQFNPIPGDLQLRYNDYIETTLPGIEAIAPNVWTPPIFSIMALGGCGADGLHLNNAGQRLLAASFMQYARSNPAMFPGISSQGFADWEQVTTLIQALINYDDNGFPYILQDPVPGILSVINQFYGELKYPYWYMPTGMEVKHFPASSLGPALAAFPGLQVGFDITGAPPNTNVFAYVVTDTSTPPLEEHSLGYTDSKGNLRDFIPSHYALQAIKHIYYVAGNQAVNLSYVGGDGSSAAAPAPIMYAGAILNMTADEDTYVGGGGAGTEINLNWSQYSLHSPVAGVTSIEGLTASGALNSPNKINQQIRVTGMVSTNSLASGAAMQLRVVDTDNGITYAGPFVVNNTASSVIASAPIDITLRGVNFQVNLYVFGTVTLTGGTSGTASLIQLVSERLA